MPSGTVRPPFDQFLATAEAVAATLAEPGGLDDPEGVFAAYLMAAAIFRL